MVILIYKINSNHVFIQDLTDLTENEGFWEDVSVQKIIFEKKAAAYEVKLSNMLYTEPNDMRVCG